MNFAPVRRLLERCSRNVSFRRRLPQRFGGDRIWVTPSASLGYWFKPLDRIAGPLLDRLAEVTNRGDTVWDVGANVGLVAFTASWLVGTEGRVVAFEPDGFLSALLRKSAAEQAGNRAPVDVVPMAVADRQGEAPFHFSARCRASNYIAGRGNSQAGGTLRVETIPTTTLDAMCEQFPAPNVLKIDVEGAEDLVFAGAESLLSKYRPTLLCEVALKNQRLVSELLKKHGYRLYDMECPATERTPLDLAPNDTLAIPS